MGKEDVCVESKFGGDKFLAEGSFPRPCFLLGGDTVLPTPPPGCSCQGVRSQLWLSCVRGIETLEA